MDELPIKDREAYNKYMRKYRAEHPEYMKDYRKTQAEKKAEKDEWMDEAGNQLALLNEFVREQVAAGFTTEQAKQQYHNATTPPDEDRPVTQQATDSEPAPQMDVNEMVERSKRLIDQWVEMRARKRQVHADSKRPIRQTRDELEREKAIINASAEAGEYVKKHPIQENAEKLRIIKKQHELDAALEPRYGHDALKKKNKGKVSGDL